MSSSPFERNAISFRHESGRPKIATGPLIGSKIPRRDIESKNGHQCDYRNDEPGDGISAPAAWNNTNPASQTMSRMGKSPGSIGHPPFSWEVMPSGMH